MNTESDSRFLEAFLEDAYYTYSFDLNEGIVKEDIISKDGLNFTKAMGLESPCSFDEIIEKAFGASHLHIMCTVDACRDKFSCRSLLKAYDEGKRRIEVKVYIEEYKIYSRITYLLDRDDKTGHVICFVVCQDITDIEDEWVGANKSAVRELEETDNILSCAGIGIWKIYLFDGEKPRMKASPKMRELLGVDDNSFSEEEIYDFWYGRIKKSSLPSVEQSVHDLIEKGIGENTYVWNHPKSGERFVRCGGSSQYVEGKGYVLRGYHSDVTDIINSDTRQKQLLADALEETEKQKRLLQETLDNYKQADYDRRTDFLTGLRNRQDLYELLQDDLSGMRGSITSMFMMDIDNFKMLNDHYGHTYGDECLKKIGVALIEYGKENNMYFYRYGGEEMLGISFNEKRPASRIAEELVRLVYDLRIKRDDMPAGAVTVSLGYTESKGQYEKMIDRADSAMYRAKANGRNRAVCYEKMMVL